MFTKEQAAAIAQEHSYLIGKQISKGFRVAGIIEDLILAPLDGINQHKFLVAYKQSGNAVQALQFYSGTFVTVLVVARPVVSRSQFFTVDLETYLREHPEQQKRSMLV